MVIGYNPLDNFQIVQFMFREEISTAICWQEVKKTSFHPTKSLWSLQDSTSGVSSSDFSVALGQELKAQAARQAHLSWASVMAWVWN